MSATARPTASTPGAARIPIDWTSVSLPDAWPDALDLRRPWHLARFLGRLATRRRPVELPPGLPGAATLPDYLRLEFHHLPNGNYSKRIVDGYLRWIDVMMLGRMRHAWREVASRLMGATVALDVGCGSGGVAGALIAAGVPEVWGLDPSPYMLREAALRHPDVRLVQGVAEDTGFAQSSFDAVAACFLFHELPPATADAALDELYRILTPGAMLVIVEPSALQFRPRGLYRFLRRHGGLGLYFWLMTLLVYEPYVAGWHARDVNAWFDTHGFSLREDSVRMPMRLLRAVRQA